MMTTLPCPFCRAPLPTAEIPAACAASLCIRGAYQLTGWLGQGGLARVYQAVRVADGTKWLSMLTIKKRCVRSAAFPWFSRFAHTWLLAVHGRYPIKSVQLRRTS